MEYLLAATGDLLSLADMKALIFDLDATLLTGFLMLWLFKPETKRIVSNSPG